MGFGRYRFLGPPISVSYRVVGSAPASCAGAGGSACFLPSSLFFLFSLSLSLFLFMYAYFLSFSLSFPSLFLLLLSEFVSVSFLAFHASFIQ